MIMLKKTNDKGIGAILILLAIAIVIVIAIIVYFLFKSSNQRAAEIGKTSTNQPTSSEPIRADQVPLKICPTGDPEQCEDPIPDSAVDTVQVDDLP